MPGYSSVRGIFVIASVWFSCVPKVFAQYHVRRQQAKQVPEKAQTSLSVFWHVRNRDEIVMDQLSQLLNSTAYREYAMHVKWVTPADSCVGNARTFPSSKVRAMLHKLGAEGRFSHVPFHGRLFACGTPEAFEMPTLYALHEHCSKSEHADHAVAYIHTKTSFERQIMMGSLFSGRGVRKCMDCLRHGAVACGPYLYAEVPPHKCLCDAPWCHFQGNFWWARCNYVSKLNPPWSELIVGESNQTGMGRKSRGWWGDIRPYGRYFAEWWLLNDIAEAHRVRAPLGGYVVDQIGYQNVSRQGHLIEAFGSTPTSKASCSSPKLTAHGTKYANGSTRALPRGPRQCSAREHGGFCSINKPSGPKYKARRCG